MTNQLKKYNTIGCCGIDCGLCPRFYTKGESACPGCGGPGFRDKHPSCGFVTCCAIKKGLEVCSECAGYPCNRFDAEKEGLDSFVTHKKVFSNLNYIKTEGIESFINQQNIRIKILNDFLEKGDDGRSKSFFCLSCALLPPDKLLVSEKYLHSLSDSLELKEKARLLKSYLQNIAAELEINLTLNNKKS